MNNQLIGVVTNCDALSILDTPQLEGEVVAVIPAATEVGVYPDDSTDIFYNVCTAIGLEGFCDKRYIEIVQ